MKVVDPDDNDLPQGEVGEIVLRSPHVMRGYYNRPDATAEVMRDGWFHTGDLAYVDEEGYFFIVDRKKDLIIRGGYNVYPREIEEVIYEHPAVLEVAVIGVADASLGEEVGAAVALQPRRRRLRRRAARLRQGARRGLQVPAPGLARRRAAQGADGQGPQAGDLGAGELTGAERRYPSFPTASPYIAISRPTASPTTAGTTPRFSTMRPASMSARRNSSSSRSAAH